MSGAGAGDGLLPYGTRGGGAARVKVRIAGDDYVLRGSGSTERLQTLAEELNRRLGAVRQHHPRLALHQAAVLCALQLLDELEQLRAENRELMELLSEPR